MEIMAENFEKEVLDCDKTVIVDFFATWCAPCKMLAPTLEAFAERFANDVKLVKIDVDKNTDLAIKYGVMSVPTLVLFKNGEMTDQSVGYIDEDELYSFVF